MTYIERLRVTKEEGSLRRPDSWISGILQLVDGKSWMEAIVHITI